VPIKGVVEMALTAKDIMTKRVVTVSPRTTVKELTELLAAKKISGVPVVDEQKRVIGIATEADVLAHPGAKTVEEIMTKRVISVKPDTPVEEIAKLLAKKKIKRVPVIDEKGKLVGIVSRADIVKAFAGK
jgi:CBS domain-containing protein